MSTATTRRTSSSTRRGPTRLIDLGTTGLERQAPRWPLDALMLLAAAPVLWGLGQLTARPVLGTAGALLLLALTSARVAFGVRAQRRAAVRDQLLEALAPLLGLRPPRRTSVVLSRWQGFWSLTPRRVRLSYAPGIADDDEDWGAKVLATVERRLLASYTVSGHDRRRLRLAFTLREERSSSVESALERRAENAVTEMFGPRSKVTDTEWVAEELVRLEVSHEASVKMASQAARTRIDRTMTTILPGRWRSHWDLIADTVRFELRPSMPTSIPHPAPSDAPEDRYRLPIGVSEDADTISWTLRGAAPHMIVVGKTGQGKTVVITGIVAEAAYRGFKIRICDPKRIEFMGLRPWPNVEIVATSVEDQITTIYRTWEEMEQRYEIIESGLGTEDAFEPVILVLDEYRDFVGMATEWYGSVKRRGMPAKCPVFEKVSSIARKGRTAKIHIVLGTQRPDADFLSGEMRDNFATRASLGRLSPQGALMMWEAAHVGVSVPRGVPGRGTGLIDDDRPGEMQAYWTPDPRRLNPEDHENRKILERLLPAETSHPRCTVEQNRSDLVDLDTGELDEWECVINAQLVPVSDDLAQQHPLKPTTLTALADPRVAGGGVPRMDKALSGEAAHVDAIDAPNSADRDDLDELEEEYTPAQQRRIGNVRAGDLVLVDEELDLWGVVVADAEQLEDETGVMAIEWRSDTDDDGGWLELPDDDTVTVRRPLDDLDD